MAYHYYSSDSLSTFLEQDPSIFQNGDLFLEQPWLVVQNNQYKKFLEKTLTKKLGVWINSNFHFADESVRKILEKYCQEEKKLYFQDELSVLIYVLLMSDDTKKDYAKVATYVKKKGESGMALCDQIASLFHHYGQNYPEMVLAWENNQCITPESNVLFHEERWQSSLWRKIYTEEVSPEAISFPSLLQKWNKKRTANLPKIVLFGSTFLSVCQMDFFYSLAESTEVYHFHLMPAGDGAGVFKHWRTLGDAHHRRLHALGQGSSLALSFNDKPQQRQGLLHFFKNKLIGRDSELPNSNDSFRILSCWGKKRQFEIVKDEILNRLSKGVSPSDIAVLMPGMDGFSEQIREILSSGPSVPNTIISGSHTSLAYLQGIDLLMNLVGGRYTLMDVFALLQHPSCQAQFGWGADDIAKLYALCDRLNVRWGLSLSHRESMGQRGGQGTWSLAIGRLLTGMAIDNFDGDSVWNEELRPYNLNDSAMETSVGQLIDFVDKCERYLEPLNGFTLGLETWVDLIKVTVGEFLGVREEDQANKLLFQQVLTELVELARLTVLTKEEKFNFESFKFILEKKLQERLSQSISHRQEGVLIGDFQSLRGIPFDHVFVLGMNEGEYPSLKKKPSFDMSETLEQLGGLPSARSSGEAYMMIELLLSAKISLTVLYSGYDPVTQAKKNLSPYVQMLVDDAKEKGLAISIEEHPLQSYNSVYFEDGSSFKSYSMHAFEQAKKLIESTQSTYEMDFSSKIEERYDFSLSEMVRWFKNPLRESLRIHGVAPQQEIKKSNDWEPWDFPDFFFPSVLEDFPIEEQVELDGILPSGSLKKIMQDRWEKTKGFFEQQWLPVVKNNPPQRHVFTAQVGMGEKQNKQALNVHGCYINANITLYNHIQPVVFHSSRAIQLFNPETFEQFHVLFPAYVNALYLAATDGTCPFYSMYLMRPVTERQGEQVLPMKKVSFSVSSQKAKQTMEAMVDFYLKHRGLLLPLNLNVMLGLFKDGQYDLKVLEKMVNIEKNKYPFPNQMFQHFFETLPSLDMKGLGESLESIFSPAKGIELIVD